MNTEPHSLDAERAVLGACLIDRDAILAVAPLIGPDDFHERGHQHIYRTILDLYYDRVPTDLVTLCERLGRKLEQVGGELYLAALIADTPTSVHAEYYAGIVADHGLRRRMIRAGQEIAKAGYDIDQTTDELVLQAESELQQVMNTHHSGSTESLGELMDSFSRDLGAGPRQFVPFGYRRLDELVGGMEDGTVTVVAGRPSMGKTGFAFGTAMRLARAQKQRVLMISLEMTNRQMVHRALSMWTGLDSRKIRAHALTPDEREIVAETAQHMQGWTLELSRSWGSEISQVMNQIRSYHAARGIDLLIIDGLWLLEWSGAKGNRVQEVGKISRLVKLLAMDLEIPVMLLHQLNRALMGRSDRTPILSDLRESGDVEQDADVVIFVHRPGMVDESEARDYAHIIVAKNRQGPIGTLAMRFNEMTTEFFDSDPARIELARRHA